MYYRWRINFCVILEWVYLVRLQSTIFIKPYKNIIDWLEHIFIALNSIHGQKFKNFDLPLPETLTCQVCMVLFYDKGHIQLMTQTHFCPPVYFSILCCTKGGMCFKIYFIINAWNNMFKLSVAGFQNVT